MALDPSVPRQYVPYRDSKLTRLLQNSIGEPAIVFKATREAAMQSSLLTFLCLCSPGGNSYTAVLATIHPRKSDYEECLSTLQFANRCRNVRNQVCAPSAPPRPGHCGACKLTLVRGLVLGFCFCVSLAAPCELCGPNSRVQGEADPRAAGAGAQAEPALGWCVALNARDTLSWV